MNDIELWRLGRCKRCSKSTEADDFQGGTELYCPLHGYPCDMIIQCAYVPDNKVISENGREGKKTVKK